MPSDYLAIEIGGTKLQIVTGTATGAILERRRLTVDRSQGGTAIRAQIEQSLNVLIPTSSIAAIGVGFGGPVDRATGRIRCSHQIEGWSDFPIANWLYSITRLPVAIDNDANVAALGEASCGAGSGSDTVFYVTLGSGVGGGFVVHGTIYHGASPGEAEIGHVKLDRDCATLESRCSGWAVDRKIRELSAAHPESILARLTANTMQGEARHLADAIHAGDTHAQRILAETVDDLAFGLSHVVHLLHPNCIVLGGGLSLVGEPLRSAIEERLPRYVMEAFAPGPVVRLAALGEDAVPVGALILAARALAA